MHCVKSVQIRSFFWSVLSHIQAEYWKIRTRKNSVFGHFSHSDGYQKYFFSSFSAWCPLKGHTYSKLQLKASGLLSICRLLVETRH